MKKVMVQVHMTYVATHRWIVGYLDARLIIVEQSHLINMLLKKYRVIVGIVDRLKLLSIDWIQMPSLVAKAMTIYLASMDDNVE